MSHTEEQTKANEALVSAAPDMLKKLDIVYATLLQLHAIGEISGRKENQEIYKNLMKSIYLTTQKARGKA